MFVLQEEFAVDWPVNVMVPKDGGGFLKQPCTVTFQAMPTDEAETKRAAIMALPEDEQDAAHMELLMDTMTGWSGVVDADKQPIPFSRDNLATALKFSFVLTAFTKGYSEAFSGAGKETRRRGN